MIDHTNCDHPRTSSARARCRRLHTNGEEGAQRKKMGATPREPGSGGDGKPDNYGQTPRDKADECHKCGVERIAYRGTDSLTGILLYVGERCLYHIKNADDLKVVL